MTSVPVGSQVVGLGATAVKVLTAHSPLERLVCRPAVTVPGDASVAAAVEVMRVADVSALLVDGGGILTERDVARAVGAGVPVDALVADVATPHPLVVPGTMGVVEACGVMLNEEVRHLVIELADGTLGVVSLRDVAAVLLQVADPHLWLASLRVAVDAPSEIWLG